MAWMRNAGFPVVLIVIGAAWLLHSLHLVPDIHWLWILGLSGAGIGILVLDGITKSSIVAGPMLILAGIMSYCRQYYELGWRFILPIMLIAAGMLMLASRSPSIPESRKLRRNPGMPRPPPHDGRAAERERDTHG